MTDAEWRIAVMERGSDGVMWPECANCGFSNRPPNYAGLQADHLIPRAQGGQNDLLNGVPLCGPFIPFINPPLRPDGGCHLAVTDGKLKRRIEWLDPEQLAYLSDQGWLRREPDGSLSGKGVNYFDG